MTLRAIALALLSATIAFSQAEPKPINHLQAALELSGQQVQQLETLRQNRIAEIQMLRELQQTKVNKQALNELYKQETPPDPEAVGKLVLAIRADEKTVNEVKARYVESSRAVLSPEQLKKLGGLRRALKLEAAAKQALSWQLIKMPKNRP